ncbi:hypothetical protein FRACYDRAFT_272753 [Fragilariopsis cylindrus CCMP1102]|uniref:Uncharacterized protein n=1 Tax=Fragilariopsis cylindrus CCMP1102 TaxID=635003 RepID=A0A1E7EKU0_9STRA|nr:hypothetical protein FRACYDRAFT_272753 [Fragilariopsis cylindrus CCMP1102]|eukprot:OEU06531.1 hypothetical protein FRACYDRAFT_272753 [Fragilariopsis cylindrus CCMP1102]
MKLLIATIINLVLVTTVTTTNAWREDQVVMLTSWADPNECTADNFNNTDRNLICTAGNNTIPVNITLNNNGTECYVHPNNPNLVFWISRPPTTSVDRVFKPSDDLIVTYLNEAPFTIPRNDCNEQGVCVCDAINSFRESIVNDDSYNFIGGFSTTPTIRPDDSDPTWCGIDMLFGIMGQARCSPIQGTLELYLPTLTPTPNPNPTIISGGIISNQGWASAITAGCITTMIIVSMMI